MGITETTTTEQISKLTQPTPAETVDLDKTAENEKPKQEIVWTNVIVIAAFHILCFFSLFRIHTMKFLTLVWIWAYFWFGIFGITAGAHRLWSHRSYKAKRPLEVLLLVGYAAAGLNPLFTWVRDHRVHHKFSDTNADPHNANRGLFFSHVGWLMQKKHPDVAKKGQTISMKDLTSDPMLRFYNRYFLAFKMFFCFMLPVYVPVYLWNETWMNAFCSQDFIRYVIVMNVTFSVNSIAHCFGTKPYDKRIKPGENPLVSFFTLGEGWHNYHHAFPWDYKTGEFGNYTFNLTTMWLDFFQKIGLAYDMKQPSEKLVKSYIENYGDGSVKVNEYEPERNGKSE